MASGRADLGVALCGSGIGIGIAANKVPGVRAATVHDETSARLARQHNDANVLCLGERLMGVEVARDALDAWLDATFEGGRHAAAWPNWTHCCPRAAEPDPGAVRRTVPAPNPPRSDPHP